MTTVKTAMTHDPQMVEAVARRICQQSGYDPDGPVGEYYGAQWECFRGSAEAALEASHHAKLAEAAELALTLLWKWAPRRDEDVRICCTALRDSLRKIGGGE